MARTEGHAEHTQHAEHTSRTDRADRARQAMLTRTMRSLAVECGLIAVAGQAHATTTLKDDGSYVTDVDMHLSSRCIDAFSAVVPASNVLTEEQFDHVHETTQDEILVVVDPIDGTRNYAQSMPLYGISIGILRNHRPWIGCVVFPALGEMVYCDGHHVFLVRRVLTHDATQELLNPSPVDVGVGANATVLCSESFAEHYRWDHGRLHLMQTGCATINLCWPALGRGIGGLFAGHIWDLAGSWPILDHLGFQLLGLRTGRTIHTYQPADYDPTTHRIMEPAVACRPEHFERICSAVSDR